MPASPVAVSRPGLTAGGLMGLTAAACLIYGLGSGVRGNLGMLVQPIIDSTGLTYENVSLAMAVAQLASGVAGPLAGMLALRWSDRSALWTGALLLAGGLLVLPTAATSSRSSLCWVSCCPPAPGPCPSASSWASSPPA